MTHKILLIDDEPDVLEMVRAVLMTKGYEVVAARGGEEGLALAEEMTPDLIISDLMMPKVSGLEVIKRLKRHQRLRRVPIIVLSALGDDEKRPPEFWIKSLSIDDYLQKPFDPLDLLGRVEFIFRRESYVSTRSGIGLPVEEEAARADNDSDTHLPFDVGGAEPHEVVRTFIESWNNQDFAVEHQCISDEMMGGMDKHAYVARRRQTYFEEKGRGRTQKVTDVVEEKISLNVAKVVVDREDTVDGRARSRRETYTLKKTNRGWKIIGCRSVKTA